MTALVGPNGAGKSTLLHLVMGLTRPTEGDVRVLGGQPAGSAEALERVAFVAQDAPLYRHLPVADMMHLARNLNQRWDQPRAAKRLAALDIPPKRKVGKLSGGQQAQVALTIALARRPEFLVLDEPLAPLDPLARHEFLAAVMEAVAEDGISVLVLLPRADRAGAGSRLPGGAGRRAGQVAGDAGDLLATHRTLTGPANEVGQLGPAFEVVHSQAAQSQAHVLARFRPPTPAPDGWRAHPVTLEELVLAYLREPRRLGAARPGDPGRGHVTGRRRDRVRLGPGPETVECRAPAVAAADPAGAG